MIDDVTWPERSTSWPQYLWSLISQKPCEMAGSQPNLHTIVPTWACIHDVLKVKVKVKGHVIRTLFWFHENRFSQANGWIATKRAHDGPQYSPHPRCAQGQGRGHVKRALLWCHEMFAIQYRLTFCLYMHSLYEAPLHSLCSISVRQPDVMSTSWNELLRRFRCVRSPLTWYINFSFVHLQYYSIIRTSISVKPGNCPWQLQLSSYDSVWKLCDT